MHKNRYSYTHAVYTHAYGPYIFPGRTHAQVRRFTRPTHALGPYTHTAHTPARRPTHIHGPAHTRAHSPIHPNQRRTVRRHGPRINRPTTCPAHTAHSIHAHTRYTSLPPEPPHPEHPHILGANMCPVIHTRPAHTLYSPHDLHSPTTHTTSRPYILEGSLMHRLAPVYPPSPHCATPHITDPLAHTVHTHAVHLHPAYTPSPVTCPRPSQTHTRHSLLDLPHTTTRFMHMLNPHILLANTTPPVSPLPPLTYLPVHNRPAFTPALHTHPPE